MSTLKIHGLHLGAQVEFNTYKAYKDHLTGSKVIAYISGSRLENIFNSMYEIQPRNVFEWFDMLAKYKALTMEGRAAVRWLIKGLPNGCSMVRAIELAPKVTMYHGYEIDYVTDFVNKQFKMEHKLGHLVKYFDYAGYCFDLQRDKKIDKVIYEGDCYTITNADQFNVWGI
jgi:hypothetical protein